MLNLIPNEYDIKEYRESKYKNITLNEMFGRYILKERLAQKYNPNYILFTAPIYDNWDVELSTPEGRKYFEVKIRNQTYNSMLLEVDKYNKLVKDNKLSYYVNITTDTNKLIMWDLSNYNIGNVPIEQKYCPRTTYSDKNDYVMKDCYMLPISTGYTYNYNFSVSEMKNEFEKQLKNN